MPGAIRIFPRLLGSVVESIELNASNWQLSLSLSGAVRNLALFTEILKFLHALLHYNIDYSQLGTHLIKVTSDKKTILIEISVGHDGVIW